MAFRGVKYPDDCEDMDNKLEQIQSCCESTLANSTFANSDSTFKKAVNEFPPQYVAWLKQLQNNPPDLMNQLMSQLMNQTDNSIKSKWKVQAMIDSKKDDYAKDEWAEHFNTFDFDDFKHFHWASWSPKTSMLEGLRISLIANSLSNPSNDHQTLKAIPEDVLMQAFFPSGNQPLPTGDQPLQTFYKWPVADQRSLIESHPTFCIQYLSQLNKEGRNNLKLRSFIPVFAKMTPWVLDPSAIYSLFNDAYQTTYLARWRMIIHKDWKP